MKERNPSTIIFLNTKLSKKMLFCQWFKNPHGCFGEQDCTAGHEEIYNMRYLLPSSLCPGSQDGLLQGYDSFPFQLLPAAAAALQAARLQHRVLHTHTPPFHASSSLRTSKKEQHKLKLSRVGNAWDRGGLVG